MNSPTAIFEFYSRVSGSWSISSHSKIKLLFPDATCYGKTKRHFKLRMCEHLGVSALIGKRVKGDSSYSIKEHHLFCNRSSEFDDFPIIASNSNDFKVILMESLLINRDYPLWMRTDTRYLWDVLKIEGHNFIIW